MSTKPRIVAPGVIYQISSKGVQNLEMFKNDELRTFFVDQLTKTLKKYSFTCHAFSICRNQYHLVLQSDQQSISIAMQQFNSIIAKRVNKVLKRDGTVFATRFKSVIVEIDHLKSLVCIVHQQPVNLGECSIDQLDHYKWCSHSILLGYNRSELIDKENLLKLLNLNDVKEYQDYFNSIDNSATLSSTIKSVNSGKQGFRSPELWIIGTQEFVKHVIKLDQCRRLRIARHISENIDIKRIHEEVSRLLSLENDHIFRAGQFDVRSTARELFAVLCTQRYDFSGAETARYLNVTDSAISRMIFRFGKLVNGNNLKEWVIAGIS